MKLPHIGLLLLALLYAPLHVQAADTPVASTRAPNWYDVELIVFRYTDSSDGSLETWPVNPGLPDWEGAVPINPTGSRLPYMQLAPANFKLGNDWQKLARSPDYQPLLQVAWTQPAIDRASALFVRIGVPPTTPPPAGTTSALATASNADAGTPVYGTARLSTTGPYLHFDLDLVYHGTPAKVSIPDPTQPTLPGNSTPQFQWYRLLQDRRIDAGKLNYFDQPLFGALVLVTPSKTN